MSHPTCRDCLAAPGTTLAESTGSGAVGNPNKNKTCYKCHQEGHVCFLLTSCTQQSRSLAVCRLPGTAPRTLNMSPDILPSRRLYEYPVGLKQEKQWIEASDRSKMTHDHVMEGLLYLFAAVCYTSTSLYLSAPSSCQNPCV